MNKKVKEFLDNSSNYEVVEYIGNLQQENKQLKDNRDKLKEELRKIRQSTFTKYGKNEWENCLSFNDDILPLIKKNQELERSDSNEKDKKIEKIDIDNDKMTLNGYETIPTQLFEVARKVNELIDEVNKLKEGKL